MPLLPPPGTSTSRRPLFLTGIALICAVVLYSWQTFSRLESLNAGVEHTREVLAQLDSLLASTFDAAARERGFMLYGQAEVLSAYQAARGNVQSSLAEIRRLVADNPEQQRRLDEFSPRMDAALADMDRAVAARAANGPLPDSLIPSVEVLNGLRADIMTMLQAETTHYRQQAEASQRQAVTAKFLLLGGTVLSLLLMVIVFALMRREAVERDATKAELRRLNAELTADVVTRTAEVSSRDEDLDRTWAFLKLVIEHVPGMLFIKDAKEGRFVLLNRGAEELLGYDRRELIGKTDAEVFPREQAEKFLARDRRVLGRGNAETIDDETITTRDRGIRHLQTHAIPVVDEQGRAQFLLCFSEDITDRRQVEQQLRQAQKMEAIGQLTGGVAHDFNNLLMVILGNLELLEVALENQPSLYKLVRTAIRGADRGAALVKSLLAFARKQPLAPVPVDLNKLLRETVEMLVRTLGENIEVDVVAKPDLWLCEVDPGQLQSALLNLAINARDAMPAGGKLSIKTDCAKLDETAAREAEVRAGDYVVLAVSDTGTGMSADILDRVFDPFFTTKEPGKGSGLGLSMVYGMVKQSRGHVKIMSEVGRGTTVRIYLPRVYDSTDQEPAAVATELRARAAETVLVVEDDNDVRTLTVTMLQGLGYRVLAAATVEDAHVALAKTAPDLLLTDVVLTGMWNGRQLADDARGRYPQLKVLFMSGYAESTVLHQGQFADNVQLIQKPFRKQDLAAKVRAVLDEPPTK